MPPAALVGVCRNLLVHGPIQKSTLHLLVPCLFHLFFLEKELMAFPLIEILFLATDALHNDETIEIYEE